MQIFELHFNPKIKEEKTFDSFVYYPKNAYEKKLGDLYLVGELENTLPQNVKFLDKLAKIIKENYYSFYNRSPEKALSECLKKANEYLAQEIKKDNVSWLGNLNFAILALYNSTLIFTKTGEIKILLLRGGQVIEVGKELDLNEIEPYPLKIFFNIATGKVGENDIILVLTNEIFNFFKWQNILNKLAQLKNVDSKKIKEVIPSSLFIKGEGSKVSGICFLTVIEPKEKKIKKFLKIFFKNNTKVKKLSEIPPFKFFSQLFRPFRNFSLEIFRQKSKNIIKKLQLSTETKNKLKLFFLLILILLLGFLIFQEKDNNNKEKTTNKDFFIKIEERIQEADKFLIFKEEKKANEILKSIWQEICSVKETPEIYGLKNRVKEKLEKLNNLEKIENPELVSQSNSNLFFSPSNYVVKPPQFDFNFDISASYLDNLYFLDKKTCKIIKYAYHLQTKTFKEAILWKEKDEKCINPKAMAIDGSVWIVNSDNSIIRYYFGLWQETLKIDIFPHLKNITQIKTGKNIPYLYLLEPEEKRVIVVNKKGEIIKQFQSEKFDNLKDINISSDGKIIYLLNKTEVYKVKLF